MKRKQFLRVPLIAVGILLVACSGEERLDVQTLTKPMTAKQPTWRMSIHACPGEDVESHAISMGGNPGKVLHTNWDNGDEIQVVSHGAVVGQLTANLSDNNTSIAQLDGTLTGTYAVGDAVMLYNHHATLDYTHQAGTLADVSTNCAYLMGQSSVEAVDANDGSLQMTDVTFSHMQAFLDLDFYTPGLGPLNISSLKIYSSSGKLVLTKEIDGTTTYAQENHCLEIVPKNATNHLFLALRNESGHADTYTFVAQAGSEYYVGTLKKNLQNGHYYQGAFPLVAEDYDGYYISGASVTHTGYGASSGWVSDLTAEINRDNNNNGEMKDLAS